VGSLRRLYVEPFGSEPMQTLEYLAAVCASGDSPVLLPTDWPLQHLRAVHLARGQAQRLLTGQSIQTELGAPEGRVRLYDETGTFLGLGARDARGTLRPRRLLNP
jgi:tRNA pseudouridine55 synthase